MNPYQFIHILPTDLQLEVYSFLSTNGVLDSHRVLMKSILQDKCFYNLYKDFNNEFEKAVLDVINKDKNMRELIYFNDYEINDEVPLGMALYNKPKKGKIVRRVYKSIIFKDEYNRMMYSEGDICYKMYDAYPIKINGLKYEMFISKK